MREFQNCERNQNSMIAFKSKGAWAKEDSQIVSSLE